MNTSNIKKFATFDLTINKAFYRNMIIMAICVNVGIATLCFLGRWFAYNSELTIVEQMGGTVMPYSPNHFSNAPATGFFLSLIMNMLPVIFAGCTFHNFRKRQSRLTELTIPVPNKDKYIWHILVSIVGGIAVAILSLLLADLTNYLLHLLVYGNEYTFSLTSNVFNIMTFNMPNSQMAQRVLELPVLELLTSLRWMTLASTVMGLCVYIYGNSVRYRWNIIITYAIMLVVSIAFVIIFGWLFRMMHSNIIIDKENKDIVLGDLALWIRYVSVLMLVISVLCAWRSYKRYCKAQITTSTNK